MTHLLERLSVVGTITVNDERRDVCAEAQATYAPGHRNLTVVLDCFLRHPDPARHAERERISWMPPRQVVHEFVDAAEASAVAHDIATRWGRRVGACIPEPVS